MRGRLECDCAGHEGTEPFSEVTTEVTAADEQQFRDLCLQVRTAWSRQDLEILRKVTPPETLLYFRNALADKRSLEVGNRVENVMVMNAEVREFWAEDDRVYATVLLHWKAWNYTMPLAKQPNEPRFLIEGDRLTPTDMHEVWTFVRH